MATASVLDRKKAHARKRFDERYGICLDDNLSKRIIEQIQTRDQAERLCFISHRVSVWYVFVPKEFIKGANAGIMVPVVYDKDRKMLVTALPADCNEASRVPVDADCY